MNKADSIYEMNTLIRLLETLLVHNNDLMTTEERKSLDELKEKTILKLKGLLD